MNKSLPFQCQVCEQKFQSVKQLEAHRQLSHSKIEIPEEQGTDAVVLTWDNGQRSYVWFGEWDGNDYNAALVVGMVNTFLSDEGFAKKHFLGLPSAERPEHATWFTRAFLRDHVAHVHDARVVSPLAQRKMGGKQIVVPLPGTRIPRADS